MRYGCNHVYVLMCSSLSRGEVSTHAFLNVNAVFHGCIKDHIVHCTAHGEFLTQRFAGKALSSTLVFGFATGPGTLRIVEIQNIIITKYSNNWYLFSVQNHAYIMWYSLQYHYRIIYRHNVHKTCNGMCKEITVVIRCELSASLLISTLLCKSRLRNWS